MTIRYLEDEYMLLGKVAAGDHDAFKVIYDCFHESVYTFSLWYLKSEAEAEETVQEIFLKLWQLGPELRNINNLDSFLKTLTRNRALDVLRRQAREVRAGVAQSLDWKEGHDGTLEEILLNDTHKVLQAGIALLPAKQRLVYQLCAEQGLKNDLVASQLNLSPLTVRTHRKLALKFLRTYVSKHTDVVALFVVLKLF
jgi:RNA polymerase sigma factor (sigma-70 family)